MREVALGDVLQARRDAVQLEDDVEYATVGVLNFGRGLFRRPIVYGRDVSYPTYYRVSAGQFIYSKLFAWEGALTVVPEELDGLFVSQEFPTFDVARDAALPEFLRIVTTWPELWSRVQLGESGMGGRRKRVHPDRLLEVMIPLPALAEQRRIVDLIAAIDDDIRSADRLVESAATARTAMTTALLTQQDDGWTETTIGEVAAIRGSKSDPSHVTPDLPYVGLEHVFTGELWIREVGRAGDMSSVVSRFEKGDTLFGRLRPYLRKVALAHFGGVCTSEILVLRPNIERVIPGFLHLLVSSESTIQWCIAKSAGSRMPRTSATDLLAAAVLLPPLAEQRRIVDLITSLDELRGSARDGAAALRSTRSAVLGDLLSGEHEIPESYDALIEVAS